MKSVQLGRSGLDVSPLCLGTMTFGWTTDPTTSFDIMDAAVEHGITFFDTADMYSRWADGHKGGESEEIIGAWLQKRGQRDDVIIATKARVQMWDGPDGEGLSRAHLVRAVEDSLRRLQTDVIDLYQCHWPDEDTPIEETLTAMDEMVTSGKVRAIGLSNYTATQLRESLDASSSTNLARWESLQPHYSMLHREEFEAELASLCVDENIGVIPYSPLAGGFLTGKHRRDAEPASSRGLVKELAADPRAHDVIDLLREIADGYSVPPAQVALAWLMAQPGVTSPIVGARTLDHLLGVVGAVDVALTENEIHQLSEASTGF